MCLCDLPAMDDYWNVQMKYDLVANEMSSKRLKLLKRHIHFADNNSERQNEGKFWKVRPLFEMFRNQCKKDEGSSFQSVDEVMLHYKGNITSCAKCKMMHTDI